jgi:alkanesulfonate monooxygenase SsuD/methylene tetrahydromethanopterin reductase-like flavin-dependent oxidoreductase (luciferase family)
MADIPFFRYCYVAETEAEVQRDTAARLDWVADIMDWRRNINRGSEVNQRLDDWRRQRTQAPQGHEYLSRHRALVGTPDQCVAQIRELQKIGIDYFGCNFDFGGMEHRKVLKSMALFAREVMPQLA